MGALASASGLCGCGSSSSEGTLGVDTDTVEGWEEGCEVHSYPVTLKMYVDENLGTAQMDSFIERYQAQDSFRALVSLESECFTLEELTAMAEAGDFGDADFVLALEDVVDIANEADALNTYNDIYLFNLRYHMMEKPCIVRAEGSDVELPPAATLNGEDASDASFTQLMNLGDFDGHVAISKPETNVEGRCGNICLWKAGLYDNGSDSETNGLDGDYVAEIADIIRVYDTQDEAMAAVLSGECELGFSCTGLVYEGTETCYLPTGGSLAYSAAATATTEEAGVVWDLFVFIMQCS